jgi:hypothetical protein
LRRRYVAFPCIPLHSLAFPCIPRKREREREREREIPLLVTFVPDHRATYLPTYLL